MAMKRATNLREIHQSCAPRPLQRDELQDFFIPTADARDPTVSRRDLLRKKLQSDPDANMKFLFAGHGGCGKSSELVKLADELSGTFVTAGFSVEVECNLAHVLVEDVLVVMMERLAAAAQEADLGEQLARSKALEEVYRWFSQELEIEESVVQTGLEVTAGVDVSRSLLSKVIGVLFSAKASIQRNDERIRRAITEKPHRLSALLDRCNLLINSVKQALHETNRKLLIVVEDLDKLNLVDAREIFVERPAILAQLTANVICTVPIFLLHTPDREVFERHFEIHLLPMMKVVDFEGERFDDSEAVFREIIRRRMDPDLIVDDALRMLIGKTGGVLRDIFKVLVVAAQAAESLHERGRQPQPVINCDNVRYGLNRCKNEYSRTISVVNLPDNWKVTIDDLWNRLRELQGMPVRRIPGDHVSMVLLKAKAIIEYNEKGWFALHPLIAELIDLLPSDDGP